jgi:hypothetical protein
VFVRKKESLHRVFFLINCRSHLRVDSHAILWWKGASRVVEECDVGAGVGLWSWAPWKSKLEMQRLLLVDAIVVPVGVFFVLCRGASRGARDVLVLYLSLEGRKRKGVPLIFIVDSEGIAERSSESRDNVK